MKTAYLFLSVVTNFEENIFYMSCTKVCHSGYHGVSEGKGVLPPPFIAAINLFFEG